MSVQNWLQAAALAACVIGITPLLGTYLAKLHGGGNAPGDRLINDPGPGPPDRLHDANCASKTSQPENAYRRGMSPDSENRRRKA